MKINKRRLLVYALVITLPVILLIESLALAQGQGLLTRITTGVPEDRGSFDPSISDDGTKIVFTSPSDFLGQGNPEFYSEIWLYDTTTMTLTRVTTASHSDRLSQLGVVSADGTKIAFSSNADFLGQGIPWTQYEIWLYDTATMTLTRITTSEPSDRLSHAPGLNADGTKIAFVSNADFLGQGIPSSQNEVWLYDTATMTHTRLTTTTPSGRSHFDPSLSADGTKITFYSDADFLGQGIPSSQREIWLYDTTTMTLTRVTSASHSGRDSRSPSISADGTMLAFFSDSDLLGQGIEAGQYEIWLYNTTTMTFTRITNASPAEPFSLRPSISSDGTKIVFYSRVDFLNPGVSYPQFETWLYDISAMTFKRITYASHSNRDSQFPDINADGTKIVFMSDSDFLSQGIPYNKNEVWLYQPATSVIYLPVVTHDVNSNSVIWNGVWETDCGLGACGEMNLAHIGNIVIGTYADGDGALFGVVSGNGLSGTWSRSGASGTFDFWIEGSGNRWHGNFDKTSPWCGRRAGESYLSPCGVSSWYGTWTTNCGISACGDMILQQSGDSVAGTYAAGDGVLAGTVNGSELTGTWTRGVGIGTFKMFMLPNGDQFNGNWDLTNAWCGFRNAVGDPVPCLRN